MVTCMEDREIGVVSGRLPDNPGELACMQLETREIYLHYSLCLQKRTAITSEQKKRKPLPWQTKIKPDKLCTFKFSSF